jgi:hypothetical protein
MSDDPACYPLAQQILMGPPQRAWSEKLQRHVMVVQVTLVLMNGESITHYATGDAMGGLNDQMRDYMDFSDMLMGLNADDDEEEGEPCP